MSSFDPYSLPLYCYTCGEEGHVSSDCSLYNNLQPSYPDEERCHYCGHYGHNQSACPQLHPPPPSISNISHQPLSFCHTCGESGHHSSDCPSHPNPPIPSPSSQSVLDPSYTKNNQELVILCKTAIASINEEKAKNDILRNQIVELESSLASMHPPSSVDADRLQFITAKCTDLLSINESLEDEILQSRDCCSQLKEQVSALTSQAQKDNLVIFDL